MLDLLLASAPHAGIRPHWLTASLLTHTVIIAAAIAGTRATLDAARLVPPDETMLLFVPKPPPPPPPEAMPRDAPRLVLAAPPAKGFQTVLAPTDIPKDIPPLDLKERALDPRDFTGRGVEGGLSAGLEGATGTVNVFDAGPDAIYEATLADDRFQPAILVSEPTPKYPPQLQAAGVTGRVAVEFVVDTTGRVEPGSIKVLESTHQAFEASALTTVAGAVFHPARLAARAVRQLTRQSVRFVAAE
jgi:TonB family protein